MIKKYILGLFIAVLLPTSLVFASNPSLTLTGSGDGSTVLIGVTGADGNSNVNLYFNEASTNALHVQQVGTTDASGAFTGSLNTSTLDITSLTPVHFVINGYLTNSLMWPYNKVTTVPQINFSQTNPMVNVGQSGTVTVTGGNGSYYISTNSNNNVINASLSGSTLTFSGVSSGSSVIKVCSMTENLCGSITVSTNGYSNGSLSLSPSTLSIAVGQSGTTQIANGSAPYTITTTNGNGVAYSFTGNALTISATTNGTRTLSVCSSNGTCTQLTVNVSNSPNNNTLSLSPSTATLSTGQSSLVQIYGGTAPYSVYTMSGNSVSQSVSGSTITINGVTNGVSTLNVCSSNGQCATFSVTVGGQAQNPSSSINFTFPLAINEIENISLSGGNGSSYYLQSTMSSPVLATILGSTLTVKGVTYGSVTANVCQNSNGTCLPITFTVNQAAEQNGTGGPFTFNNDLYIGLTSTDVAELQRILIDDNYLSSAVTSYFGDLTFAAVQKYQNANGISNTGYVGPLTRGALNR